jgi:hypothetical protein
MPALAAPAGAEIRRPVVSGLGVALKH